MSKIEVPQELRDKIVYLYTHENQNRKQIKQSLELSFGDSVIKRVLEESGVEIRTNPGAQKGGRKKQEVSIDLQKKIVELYEQGNGMQKIVEMLHLNHGTDWVKRILKDHGVQIRNALEASQTRKNVDLRKYKLNDDYPLESHNGAWLMGFIAADGYLPITNGAMNRVVITLQRQDEDLLEMIKKELEYTGPIYQYYNKDYPASSLTFTSQKIRRQLENYGIVNNKTFKLKHLPNLSDEHKLDFIRGFFDGDGSLFEPKGKKINMSFTCASRELLEEIGMFLHEYCGVSIPTIHESQRKHVVYDMRYYVADSIILGNLFYCNDYLSLPRKKKHFLEIKEKYNI